MKLYIDTSERDRITIRLDNLEYVADAKQDKSQRLLPFIIETLQVHNKKVADLTEIEVHTGPGSFTGLRVGVSVANALGWALDIPVNGCDLRNGEIPEIKYE